VHEMASDGHRLANFQAGPLAKAGSLTESPAASSNYSCPEIAYCAGAIATDPVTEVKRELRDGELVIVAQATHFEGRIVEELSTPKTGPISRTPTTILLNPKTGVPIQITIRWGTKPWPASPVDTITITDYQHLPPTPSNLKLLTMRPHPGAQITCSGPSGGGPARPCPGNASQALNRP